jgi:hypothetical protein
MLASRDITYIIKSKETLSRLLPYHVMRPRPASWAVGTQFFKSIICPYLSFVHSFVLLHE